MYFLFKCPCGVPIVDFEDEYLVDEDEQAVRNIVAQVKVHIAQYHPNEFHYESDKDLEYDIRHGMMKSQENPL